MEKIASHFGSNIQTDSLFYEIYLTKNRNSIALLEKNKEGFVLTFPDEISVNAEEFIKLLQRGIQGL